jgi:CDP-diacylglycerol--glycerol-3-phosphate 3-phosphatidyltransferase
VAAALVSLLTIDKVEAWIVVVIIGRELAVTGLRAVGGCRGDRPGLAAGQGRR